MRASGHFRGRTSWLFAFALLACASRRAPRPTLLDLTPPLPPPESNEARLMPIELHPEAREPIETAPGSSLQSMARRALDTSQIDLVRCYEQVLVHHPTASGSVEVQLDLSSRGAVTRAHVDQRGEGGFEGLLPCVRDVFTSIHVRDVEVRGQYVSRMYTFRNPPIERTLQTPVVIAAPPRPVRARVRPRRGAPAPVAPVVVAPGVPRPSPGAIRAEEITRSLNATPALQECAAVATRRPRRPVATGTLSFTIGADGTVSEPLYDSAPAAPPAVAACVITAVGALRFRVSGIVVHAQVPLSLRR